MKDYADRLVDWIQEVVKNAGAQGVVFGLSGGLDSSVLAVLCKKAFPQNSLGLIMPCYSHAEDEEHARLVSDAFDIPFKVLVLDDLLDLFMSKFGREEDYQHSELAVANIKPRLRMICLYYYAARWGYLVAGSSNRSEISVGYFTKYGDNASDFMPLANLVKGQVKEMARSLGVPSKIIEKPPSGGLWPEQTDEGEMGVTYDDIDKYLSEGSGDQGTRDNIEIMIKGSQHKRVMPPVPDF
ncbi:MAG: NAD(+) synthase [Candidatus Syntrophonatronum acetioxidans]|uniref:NH(3)-dependent NAD(+) synthetase n=1 Tax=Candidatus Syntrophonatronum acetioxidans TaxID=1795816 RepID=A0A424YHB1_9FIRM|nr:MAG: NAD(+) synthase [Candidatus Syntrophonatronum acetioxidans]